VIPPVKALLTVHVDHPTVALAPIPWSWRPGLGRRALRAEPVAARREGFVPLRLQPLQHRLLDDSVQRRRSPELPDPTPRLRDRHPRHRRRSVRPGSQGRPYPWPGLAQLPRPLPDRHPVDPWAARVPRDAPPCSAEMPSLHHPCPPPLVATRGVPSRGSHRRFTPPFSEGQLPLRPRCPAAVPPPVNPPADRAGLPHALACLRYPLLTSAGSAARMLPRSGRFAREPPADRPGSGPELSGRRRRLDHVHPPAAGGLRGHVPPRPGWSPTSEPVPVRRPAPGDGASSRRHLAMPPWPCSSPSAPRIPGGGTCTPQALCHTWHTRPTLSGGRCVARPLQRGDTD
jgi:hypothetical protein